MTNEILEKLKKDLESIKKEWTEEKKETSSIKFKIDKLISYYNLRQYDPAITHITYDVEFFIHEVENIILKEE